MRKLEKEKYFERLYVIEVMAKRVKTMLYGPMKPVVLGTQTTIRGLVIANSKPLSTVVQLRQ